jgi:hypothetical protein
VDLCSGHSKGSIKVNCVKALFDIWGGTVSKLGLF